MKSAPVKEPKKAPAWGAKVVMTEPMARGTIIMPPGMRSMVRLMGMGIASSRYMVGPKGEKRIAEDTKETREHRERPG